MRVCEQDCSEHQLWENVTDSPEVQDGMSFQRSHVVVLYGMSSQRYGMSSQRSHVVMGDALAHVKHYKPLQEYVHNLKMHLQSANLDWHVSLF